MEKLPKELFIEIFSYLKFNDLCQLTLTCKSFNEIISNNSTLMDKFRLKYNNDNEINVDLMMARKYKRILIQIVNERLYKFLENYGDNICEIKFCYSNLESQEIVKILNFCSNFKQLKFIRMFFNDDWIEALSKLSFEKLVLVNSTIYNVKTASVSNEKSLELRLKRSISKNFINFLKNQKQLKTLRVGGYDHCFQLFTDDSLENVDFQLETLFFALLSNSQVINRNNFKKFLINQKSLRKFTNCDFCHKNYSNFDYADILNNLKDIKELEVMNLYFTTIPLQHIKRLTIYMNELENYQDFKKLFPNLNTLSIYSSRKIRIVKNSTALEKNWVKMKISENVKTLTIKKIKFGNEKLFDDDVEIKIENLSICHSDNIDWLIECLKNDRIKLKSLTIEETQMKKSQQEYLESLTRGENKKIEKLKICMQMKLNENHDYVCDYLTNDESNDDAKRIKLSAK